MGIDSEAGQTEQAKGIGKFLVNPLCDFFEPIFFGVFLISVKGARRLGPNQICLSPYSNARAHRLPFPPRAIDQVGGRGVVAVRERLA